MSWIKPRKIESLYLRPLIIVNLYLYLNLGAQITVIPDSDFRVSLLIAFDKARQVNLSNPQGLIQREGVIGYHLPSIELSQGHTRRDIGRWHNTTTVIIVL